VTAANVAFLLILIVAAGAFSYSAQRLYRFLCLGRDVSRSDGLGRRFWNLVVIGILQRKILRDPVAGPLHATVFWGFIVLTAGSVEVLVQGVFPAFSYERLLPLELYVVFLLSQELFAAAVLAAVVLLLWRRLVVRPARLQGDKVHGGDAILVLSLIAALMITLLGTSALDHVLAPRAAAAFQPLSRLLALALAGMDAEIGRPIRDFFWWSHALLILGFLNYLPYSKHLHIVVSLPNTFLSNTSGPGPVGAMPKLDLEGERDHYGAADVVHLTWKNLLDGYACTECGRCTAACPAALTGKPLSPRKIVMSVRQRLLEAAPALLGADDPYALPLLGSNGGVASVPKGRRLLDSYISEEELWACTSCRACVYECPVSIDQLDVINALRQGLVLDEARFPEEVIPTFESLENHGTPWPFPASERGRWAEGLGIPTMAELAARGERPEILFWVGCMGSFDERARKVSVAVARLMQAAGIRFAILGPEECCHGDPARRIGNEYLYQTLATRTVETLGRYEVTRVVTACPHCFHQFAKELPEFGGRYQVLHHSQLIAKLLEEGRLRLLPGSEEFLKVAYHDSCYLGRYNDIYDAPRDALRRALPVLQLVEPGRTRDRGLCCGAGGGRMFMEERTGRRINEERAGELLGTGAEVLSVACPFCLTMVSDGARRLGSEVPVMDIAEVVASRLDNGSAE
jgi:Fe-S oxidoreductase/nitrate reductase gamma subunit